jgi:hypothetical protein
MKNKLIVATFTLSILGSIFFAFKSNASVTVGDRVNGVTTVTCRGGCTFSGGIFGSTSVCDSGGACVSIWGDIQEGSDPSGEAQR